MEIESLFSRYDKDCDRKLNELEKIKLVKDIARARNNISEEYKNFKQTRDTKIKKDAFEFVFSNFFFILRLKEFIYFL